MNSPLFHALKKYSKKNMSSFHVPGHKNNKKALLKNLLSLDYTELDETDTLFFSSSCIFAAEENTARLFNAKKTLYSAAGCTSCVQAMLTLVGPCCKIITSKTIHISAINTMSLLNQYPCFIKQELDKKTGFLKGISAEDVRQYLIENPDAKAVYLTSPDYYGVMADIKNISKLCEKFSVPLLVDAAHGSHLKFLKEDKYPGSLGASMVALSAHKNLPVLTGGAWLNIHDEKFCNDSKQAMMLFASTSPSYPIMTSLDVCTDWLEKHGRKSFLRLSNRIDKIKKLASLSGIIQASGETDDIKLSLNTAVCGISGQEFHKHLLKHKVQAEFFDDNSVVLIASPFNAERDFRRLEKAILTAKFNLNENKMKLPYTFESEFCLSPHDALMQKSTTVNTKQAQGKISAQSICHCPPGVPLIIAGERIKEENVYALLDYGISHIKVLY